MVATTRRPLDAYYTQAPLTKALLSRVPIFGTALEPCAGKGAIVRELEHYGSPEGIKILTNDIDPSKLADLHLNMSFAESWDRFPAVDWVVTNPPFCSANYIVPLAFQKARVGVAMLLRLTWLEPTKKDGDRGSWLQAHNRNLSNLIIFSQPRPSFTEDGRGDSCTTAWMVWRKNWSHGTLTDFVTEWKL